ncbi:MAG: hypothetical protein A2782_04615 [Candidatus Blackburnbacteria bacterium RIFCSPHIGHO2_01_FULL_43_15b]|uniref:Uncharacterized protein n=1 Tax=Candidatus Blackburnbacteria bacterium RIFCSPHIGHO2_01_FULL_43_15b TaxID=1797513 RepID=A0A1G1V3M5_9BACT|nr:MAG: hypothetical protein A2782_04615 [Candidatus Blackburnbacteria bacterium RIFCSPHIGHO2_01_FULL_43_15b]
MQHTTYKEVAVIDLKRADELGLVVEGDFTDIPKTEFVSFRTPQDHVAVRVVPQVVHTNIGVCTILIPRKAFDQELVEWILDSELSSPALPRHW